MLYIIMLGSMDYIDSIIPVITLIIGWLLAHIKTWFDRSTERLKVQSSLVAKMMIYMDKLQMHYYFCKNLNKFYEIWKDLGKVEEKRNLLYSEFNKSVVALKSDFSSLVDKISEVDPLLAYELNSNSFEVSFSDLSAFSGDMDKYVKNYTLQTAVIAYSIDCVEKAILKLAKWLGLVKYQKIKRKVRLIKTSCDRFEKLDKELEKRLGG